MTIRPGGYGEVRVDIRVEAPPDRFLLTAVVKHVLRRPLLGIRLLGVAVAILGAVALAIGSGILGTALVALGVCYLVVVPAWLIARSVRHSWRFCGLPTTYLLTDNGLRAITELSDSFLAWRSFDRVETLPGQLVFLVGKRRFVPVPTRSLTPEQIAQITAAVPPPGPVGRPPVPRPGSPAAG